MTPRFWLALYGGLAAACLVMMLVSRDRIGWGFAAAINAVACAIWAGHGIAREPPRPKGPKINSPGGNA